MIRITKYRKTRYVFTGYYLLPKHWDSKLKRVKKTHPNSTRLNNLFLKKLAEASKFLRNRFKRSGSGASFFDVAEDRVEQKHQEGTLSVARAEVSIVNNIEKFCGGRSLAFEDINTAWIKQYKSFCKRKLKHKSTRTVTNQLIFIRTVFNIAIKEGVVQAKHYPFAGENEKIRIKGGLKVGLTEEEVRAIEELELEVESGYWHTKNIWLFSFYFAGIRISDVLKLRWSDLKDGRLQYVMNKNEKPVSLKIPVKAVEILSHYRADKKRKSDFIFPDLKKADVNSVEDVFRKTRAATKRFDKHLKVIAERAGIEKNLSNHISRHTFGNIAGDKIHPLMLQKLYHFL